LSQIPNDNRGSRRKNDRRSEEDDRRMIERFSNSSVHQSYEIINSSLKWLMIIMGSSAVAFLVLGLIRGLRDFMAQFFMAIFMIFFIVIINRYKTSVQKYLKNESVGNMEAASEYQADFWKAATFFAAAFLIISFIFSL